MPNPSTPCARSVDEDAVIDAASCLSERLGPLGPRVKALSREYARIWREISSDPYTPDRLFTLSEKKDVERDLSLLIRRLPAEKKKFLPPGHAWESAEMEEFAASLRPCLKRILGRVELHLETVYDARFVDSTRHFLRAKTGTFPKGTPLIFDHLSKSCKKRIPDNRIPFISIYYECIRSCVITE